MAPAASAGDRYGTIYEHADYLGKAIYYPTPASTFTCSGGWTTQVDKKEQWFGAQSMAPGVSWNDQASSYKVASSCYVRLYNPAYPSSTTQEYFPDYCAPGFYCPPGQIQSGSSNRWMTRDSSGIYPYNDTTSAIWWT
jgi:hypothetical protein